MLSWAWDLPFTEDGSGFLFASQNPRPSLAPGKTLDDQTTSGSLTSRVDGYLNRDAFVRTGAQFGTLGRNSVVGPGQQRLDISVSKLFRLAGTTSAELRLEVYNVANTATFRNPVNDIGAASFGEITRTRGGPRLAQVGLNLRF